METSIIIGGVIWIMLSIFLSAFIIYFDRKKFSTPQFGFYYLALFFIAGIFLLAVSLGSLKN